MPWNHPTLLHAAALLLACAMLMTAHIVLAFGLMRRPEERWRGVLVLLPPVAWLAPIWGFRDMKGWSLAWCLGAGSYLTLFWLAPQP